MCDQCAIWPSDDDGTDHSITDEDVAMKAYECAAELLRLRPRDFDGVTRIITRYMEALLDGEGKVTDSPEYDQ